MDSKRSYQAYPESLRVRLSLSSAPTVAVAPATTGLAVAMAVARRKTSTTSRSSSSSSPKKRRSENEREPVLWGEVWGTEKSSWSLGDLFLVCNPFSLILKPVQKIFGWVSHIKRKGLAVSPSVIYFVVWMRLMVAAAQQYAERASMLDPAPASHRQDTHLLQLKMNTALVVL